MKNIIKNTNKKGFTIVELVIVIAVIAILAGVLIPTFSSIITKANESAALQEATNAYKEAYAEVISDGKIGNGTSHTEDAKGGNITFTFTSTDGSIDKITRVTTTTTIDGYTITITEGKVSVSKKN